MLAFVVGQALLLVLPVAAGDFEWAAPVNGNWSDAARWLPGPGVPGDGPADRATFSASGSAYTVLLDAARQLAGLSLSSADATLRTGGSSLRVSGDTQLAAGTLEITSPGDFQQTGGTFHLAGGTVAGELALLGSILDYQGGQVQGTIKAQDAWLQLYNNTPPAEFVVRGEIAMTYNPPQHTVTAICTVDQPLVLNDNSYSPDDPEDLFSIDNFGTLTLILADDSTASFEHDELINYNTMTIDSPKADTASFATMNQVHAFVNESSGTLVIRRDLNVEGLFGFGSLGDMRIEPNVQVKVHDPKISGFAGTLTIDPTAHLEIIGGEFTPVTFEGVQVTGAIDLTNVVVVANLLEIGPGGPSSLPLVRFRNSEIDLPVWSGNTYQIVSTSRIAAREPFAGTIDLVHSRLEAFRDFGAPAPSPQATIASSGRLSGAGSYEVSSKLINQGTIAPAAGEDLTLIQDLEQAPGGRVAIEFTLDGDTIAPSHLTVAGVAVLDGLLALDSNSLLATGQLPALGETFEIISYGSRLGAFSQVLGAGVQDSQSGANLLLRPVYGDDGLSLVMTLLGDASGDGSVGAADYAAWAAQFGQTGVNLTADFNLDQIVGAADYALWAANFGQALTASQPVPEPSAVTLLALGLAGTLGLVGARRSGARRLRAR